LSIKQDFGDLQKQMEAMRLQQQGPTEGQEKKKKKKTSDKKKRSAKNASAEIATQIAYHHELYNWSPSKWGSNSSIAVL